MVDHPAWRRDHDVRAPLQFDRLRHHVHPTTTAVRTFRGGPSTANCSAIWNASSLRAARHSHGCRDRRAGTHLVGVKTSAKIPYGSCASFCMIGTAKATVFPDPVFAFPMQSLPGTSKRAAYQRRMGRITCYKRWYTCGLDLCRSSNRHRRERRSDLPRDTKVGEGLHFVTQRDPEFILGQRFR